MAFKNDFDPNRPNYKYWSDSKGFDADRGASDEGEPENLEWDEAQKRWVPMRFGRHR